MKHAYLILAHHEFEVLKYLVAALDDVRNDIYIHFDRKVKQLPLIKTSQARLIILERRIDVRWGDISVVEAEFLLFEEAIQQKSNYSYYHLLSGVDMPLKSQDYLHDFFLRHNGKQFIGYYQGEQQAHIERKVNLYHLFPRHFRDDKSLSNFFMKILRYLWIRTQILFHLKRNKGIAFKKGTQWVSLTNDFVRYMLTQRDHVFKTYQNTFCSDEIVVQTICWNSPFQASIYDKVDESNGSQRAIQWIDNQIYDWELKDLQILLSSKLLFARKFNSGNIGLLEKLSNHLSKP